MQLTVEELESLIGCRHSEPHSLLGMHTLGDGKGIVVRALMPGASKISIRPVHEPEQPSIELKRIHNDGLFDPTSQCTEDGASSSTPIVAAIRASRSASPTRTASRAEVSTTTGIPERTIVQAARQGCLVEGRGGAPRSLAKCRHSASNDQRFAAA